MEKKAVSLIVLSILIVNLFSFASSPPGNPYTIWIHVELSGSPVSGATVKVKENATGEVGYAEDYGEGWYGINLGNFKNGWKYGDEVFIEAFYQQFYGSNSTILTNEGYSFVNISLKPNSLPSIYLVSPANNSTNVSINPILKVHVVDVDSNIMSVKFYGRKLGNLTWQLLGINTNVANNSNTSITWYNLEYG
ncbi:MAG: hypothetical protein H5T45_07615, partial [Thermoplasmatales archaeon]|nr:hypothetical protein [Thermoplasmatales archaeon]